MGFSVTPLNPTFGAEVSGMDLRKPLAAAEIDAVVEAINRYAVLVFRHDTPLTDEQQLAFGRALGPLQKLKMIKMLQGGATRLATPELIDVSNLGPDGKIRPADDRSRKYNDGNLLWHTDVSFDDNRAVYSILSARVIPPVGADTEFADMRAAYDALPDERKVELEGLKAEHSVWYSRALGGLTDVSEEEKATRPPSQHLLVHSHPRSGRKALYLASHASHIVGWPREKGRALLDELTAYATQPQFVYAHKWQAGDVVMWDNLATMHRGTTFDNLQYPRDMRRVTTLEREMAV